MHNKISRFVIAAVLDVVASARQKVCGARWERDLGYRTCAVVSPERDFSCFATLKPWDLFRTTLDNVRRDGAIYSA